MADTTRTLTLCQDAPGLYERSADANGPDYGWVGYVPWPHSLPLPANRSIDFHDAFFKYDGSYLFAAARPTTGIGGLVDGVATILKQQGGVKPRALIWIADAAASDPLPPPGDSGFVIHFAANFEGAVKTNSNFSVSFGPDDRFTFSIDWTALVCWDATLQAITFFAQWPIIGYTDARTSPPSNAGLEIVQSSLSGGPVKTVVPIVGSRSGSFTLTTQMTAAVTFAVLKPNIRFWAFDGKNDVPFEFPLVDPDALGTGTTNFATAIDPINLLNLNLPTNGPVTLDGGQVRTGMTLDDLAPTWPTFFRSVEGRTISLTPLGGAGARPFSGPSDFAGGFAFMSRQPAIGPVMNPKDCFQLVPCGEFGIVVDAVKQGTPDQTLLAGLFGSERFNFTSWDVENPEIGSRLRFQVAHPAYAPVFPFPAATLTDLTVGNVAKTRLTDVYRTSWVNIIGPASSSPLYLAEPDGGAYYGGTPANDAPLLKPTPPGTAVPQGAGFFVPIAPYANFAPDPSWTSPVTAVSEFESQILSATRKEKLGGTGTSVRAARRTRRLGRMSGAVDSQGEWRTTRQGLLAEVKAVPGATDFSKIVFAQYQPRDPTAPLTPFCILSPTEQVQEAMQTSQLFVAAVNATPLARFSQNLDIEDWQFSVEVGKGIEPTDYCNVLILKYCDGALIDWVKNPNKWTDAYDFSRIANTDAALCFTGLSTWLAAYLQDAIDQGNGTGPFASTPPNPLYANIAAIATQADWKGFLALKASLATSALPKQIQGLAAGINPNKFYAHHFGATQSRVKPNPDTGAAQTLIIDGVSSLFGLIDYQDPIYVANIASGGNPDAPLMIDTNDPYAFRVLLLQALFVNARMTGFKSRIQLTINQLFGAPVASTAFEGATQSANGIVLDGSAVIQNGTTVYVFDQGNPTLFTFATPALNGITVSRIQFNTLGVAPYAWPSGTSVPTVTSRFLFWGVFDFATVTDAQGIHPYDIFSFGSPTSGASQSVGLAYSNLQLTMRSPQSNPGVIDFAFDPSNLAFDLGGSAPRNGGLFGGFALQLQSFIYAPAGKTPLDYGFLTVEPEGAKIAALSGGWCGIVHKINMGGPGALVAAAGFSSQLLIAWSPVAGADPAAFVGLRLPGTAPGASVFSLQGVFKISTGAISLQQPAPGQFTLKLANIGATFLGIKKIPDATIQFFLFGDPDGSGSLGWYAAYTATGDAKLDVTKFPAPTGEGASV
ncbi:hypothetical protein J2X19_001763 [Rhodoferax ferrireducens]|uniref:Uncharacterized protein n=1 Tax=Rhodoferax ferrireducens TaxID=192843 RepID=A0ABU2C6Z2_9BURK|nr:hypothetical protein [Rhodoferax ferrireducens]MDR7377105.1 hypothetical protein [Rhodoferax ferrireducens]